MRNPVNQLRSLLFLLGILLLTAPRGNAQGAAPSEHLSFYFPSDAVLKMHKIKITKTAFASYFEINSFTKGYAGLQHTPDSSKGSSHTLISSLWDANTAEGIYSQVDYKATNTYTGRFGGEGDGYQSINPYNWTPDTWYNQVIRSWKSNGRLHVATFIQNLSTNEWFHTATLSLPDQSGYLGNNNDAFLENWTENGSDRDGRYVRKAFFKDCWNLNAAGNWEKHTSRHFSANSGDSVRNGIYDRAFNSGYDAAEDAYFMQHGGATTPDVAFGTGRYLELPDQTAQGNTPTLTTGSISQVSATYNNEEVIINWEINSQKSPQLSATVEILDPDQQVVITYMDTMPQRRSDTVHAALSAGNYTARVTIRDIFNQLSTPVTSNFVVTADVGTGWYRIKNGSSGKYLAIEDSATDNLKNIVQYTGTSSDGFLWQFQPYGSAFSLVNKKSNKAIDLPGGQQLSGTEPIQYPATGAINQQWDLIPISANTYLIQSSMSNHLVLDNPASSTSEGTHMIIYALNGQTGSLNQQWILEPAQTGIQGSIVTQGSLMASKRISSIKIWPNPTTSNLHIQLSKSSDQASKTHILIYNVQGKLVKKIKTNAGLQNITISLSGLATGQYFLVQGKERISFIKK